MFAPEEALLEAANRSDTGPDGLGEFTALESAAQFDRVMYNGAEFGLPAEVGSREELDYLGLPGLLDADQVAAVLRKRQADQLRHAARRRARLRPPGPPPVPAAARPVATHAQRSALRRELQTLVGAWHHRTGASHAQIHAELRRATGGPAVGTAGVDDLRRRVDASADASPRPRRGLYRCGMTSLSGSCARGLTGPR